MAVMPQLLLSILLIYNFIPSAISQSVIQLPNHRKIRGGDTDLYCDSWRLSVETNNAGYWITIPSGCTSFIGNYMTRERYLSDSEIAASDSIAFAKSVKIAGDGKDGWVFDIDETLLSNVPYYQAHGFGSEAFDELSFDAWVDEAEAPALPASLGFYKELQKMNYTIFLLTGRSEHQRNSTVKNLLFAGYTNWERLILRCYARLLVLGTLPHGLRYVGHFSHFASHDTILLGGVSDTGSLVSFVVTYPRGKSDQGTAATVYKSEKRQELLNEGYRLHGSSGDQWSDLLGFAMAERSFKLPNPMYYIE